MHEWNSKKTPAGQQWIRILDTVVTIIKYNKSTIDHYLYIKLFSDVTLPYLTVYTDDFLNTTNNERSFSELIMDFRNNFRLNSK